MAAATLTSAAMAAELETLQPPNSTTLGKRNPFHRKGKKTNKRQKKPLDGIRTKTPKPSNKMKKLYKKRAKDYNSSSEDDDDDDEEEVPADAMDADVSMPDSGNDEEGGLKDEVAGGDDEGSSGEESDGCIAPGITKFTEGCRAFKLAFLKIMKKKIAKDPLGPVLSAHKKLLAEKLAEEEGDKKANTAARKEKHLAQEKGHVKPANFLDAKEKLLISVATKGAVKLFNAVNKAQNPMKGLDPRKSKDAKVLAKRRKQTFLSELKKPTTKAIDNPPFFSTSKVPESSNRESDDEPGWAPLRDSYMLTNSKLKDWDKMQDSVQDDHEKMPSDNSSDED